MKFKHNICLYWVILILALTTACASEAQGSKIQVAVSIAPYKEWVQAIGGDRVEVTVLVPPGASPHTYEPLPRSMVKFKSAQLFVKNGCGLEFWSDKVMQVNRKVRVLDLSQVVALLPLNAEDKAEHNLSYDPHIWVSLRNARMGCQAIAKALQALDPGHQNYFRQNLSRYLAALDTLDRSLNVNAGRLPGKKFLVFHSTFGYFARDYGLEEMVIEYRGKEPGPRYLAALIDKAKAEHIKVIFADYQFNTKTAALMAGEIGARVITINPLAPDYLANMRYMSEKIYEAQK